MNSENILVIVNGFGVSQELIRFVNLTTKCSKCKIYIKIMIGRGNPKGMREVNFYPSVRIYRNSGYEWTRGQYSIEQASLSLCWRYRINDTKYTFLERNIWDYGRDVPDCEAYNQRRKTKGASTGDYRWILQLAIIFENVKGFSSFRIILN